MKYKHTTDSLEFRVFEGFIIGQMPYLISEGFVPASASQIMRGRLDGKLDWDVSYTSGDAIIYHPDGRVKLVYDAAPLRELDDGDDHVLKNYSLVLPDDAWDSLDGVVLSKEDVKKYSVKPVVIPHGADASDYEVEAESVSDIKKNPFWRFLARYDWKLLDKTAEEFLSRPKIHSGTVLKKIYINEPQDRLTMQPFHLSSVGRCGGGAGVDDLIGKDLWGSHSGYVGRLVGVKGHDAYSAVSLPSVSKDMYRKLGRALGIASLCSAVAVGYHVKSEQRSAKREVFSYLVDYVQSGKISPQEATVVMRDAKLGFFDCFSSSQRDASVMRAKSHADDIIARGKDSRSKISER
jgi:hypothetical protein